MKIKFKKGIKLSIEGGKQLPDKTYHAHKDGDEYYIFYNKEWLQIDAKYIDIIEEKLHPMQYTPQKETDFKSGGWDDFFENIKANKEHLDNIDAQQKAKGEILWRWFSMPVADGCAVYQVIKVNKTTCDVVKCYGVVPDEWEDNYLGIGCRIEKAWVEKKIEGRDALEKMFGTEKFDKKQLAV